MTKVIKGKNDFETWCLEHGQMKLLSEWDAEKNVCLPSDVAYGSAKKVYWLCPEGHSYQASLNKRTSDNTGCPYCTKSHARLLVGFNDLETTNPEVAAYWDYEKNGNLLPSMVMRGQHKKVWWKGPCGHSWQATIYHKVNGRGCPICKRESKTSFPEQAILFYVRLCFPDAINGDRHLGKELDIYIPSLKVAIEYDGEHWHQDIEKDEIKNKLCAENQIILYRIRERQCWFWPESDYLRLIPCSSGSDHELEAALEQLFVLLCQNVDIDLVRDRIDIFNQYLSSKISNSLLTINPQLAAEWNVLKNGNLSPDMVTVSSAKKVWWIGSCGHEWMASIASRNKANSGCPYCNGGRLLPGFNDLRTKRPDLLLEWSFEKNGSPENYTPGSNKKVWWKCSRCGNTYQMTVGNQSAGHGCKICAKEDVQRRYAEGLIIPHKPQSRSENSSHKREVKNIETGKVFSSLKEAGETYGIASNKISEVCSGKRKTAGGYHWQYLNKSKMSER